MSTREQQLAYWQENSLEPTVEAMMLDSQAASIDKLERPEVMAMLGSVEGRSIVELGAGIGRFTGALAPTAGSVLAVDFMEHLIAENKKANGHRGNVSFRVGDATQLDLQPGAYDVIFSNWLLMYLNDSECAKLAADALTWVKEGGTVFFRESCFKQSGDKLRKSNPTHYRNPRDYLALWEAAEVRQADGRYARYELVSCKCVDTYVRLKGNQNQICWKWRKVVADEPKKQAFRAFLDECQYSTRSILRYERIFGQGFVSTGGFATTKEFVDKLALKHGERVLDVGCGIGGGDFYMAAEHGVSVHGLDLSANMVLLALERSSTAGAARVSFEIADVMTFEAQQPFDVVYSRDTLLHIHDKPALFRRFMSFLRPGGRLLVSDYCRAEGAPTPGFAAYIKQRGYDLHDVPAYAELLRDAGFDHVEAEDRTWQFEECLARELQQIQEHRTEFVKDFSQTDYDALVTGWQDKLDRVAQGEQRWGLFTATKLIEE